MSLHQRFFNQAISELGAQKVLSFLNEKLTLSAMEPAQLKQVTFFSHRLDLVEQAKAQGLHAEFADYPLKEYPDDIEAMVVCLDKERALTRFHLNQMATLLPIDGTGYVIGHDSEGIRTAEKDLKKLFGTDQFQVVQKDKGVRLLKVIKDQVSDVRLDDQGYDSLHQIKTDTEDFPFFYSKPGVFGWKKIDQGSRLLVETLSSHPVEFQPKTLLDLGCGYGYLSLHAWRLVKPEHITGVDNNAAALRACQANFEAFGITGKVLASDSGEGIDGPFDVLLCNPPFHAGFDQDGTLLRRFLRQVKRLVPKGEIRFVVNQHIGLASAASELGFQVQLISENRSFSVFRLQVSNQ